jgi:putative oxidoreductase
MHPFGATLLRLILGVIYVMHGYLALFVYGPAGVANMIGKTMELPAADVLAWYLIGVHLVGGAMMILGLWTRWAALANVPIMAGAVFLLHWKQGFFMSARIVDVAAGRAQAIGYEFALLVLVATAAQVFLGGGMVALTRDRRR